MLLFKKRPAPDSCSAFPNRSATFLNEYIRYRRMWTNLEIFCKYIPKKGRNANILGKRFQKGFKMGKKTEARGLWIYSEA